MKIILKKPQKRQYQINLTFNGPHVPGSEVIVLVYDEEFIKDNWEEFTAFIKFLYLYYYVSDGKYKHLRGSWFKKSKEFMTSDPSYRHAMWKGNFVIEDMYEFHHCDLCEMTLFFIDENGNHKCSIEFSEDDEQSILSALTSSYDAIDDKNTFSPWYGSGEDMPLSSIENNDSSISFNKKCINHVLDLHNKNKNTT